MAAPPDALIDGWRHLEALAGLEVADRFGWTERASCWVLPCQLHLPAGGDLRVPDSTPWWIVVDREYPSGDIGFYPDGEAGLKLTFHHQRFNAAPTDGHPWRGGKLCLEHGVPVLDRRASHPREPRSSEDRLRWHVERAIEWLGAARAGTLVERGDPFELPDYPSLPHPRVGFCESADSLAFWAQLSVRSGLITFRWIGRSRHTLAIEAFLDRDERPLFSPPWGSALQGDETNPAGRGIWALLDGVPVLEPWQAPSTWGELRSVFSARGGDLDAILEGLSSRLRDGTAHIMVVGFPVPDRIGDSSSRVHWLGLHIPKLSQRGDPGVYKGRPRELAARDRTTVLGDGVTLHWLPSENWHEEEFTRRGRAGSALCTSRVGLLGAGALGSSISEGLVRIGVREITVIDPETLVPGNLVRHTLDLSQVDGPKAVMLAQRLARLAPTVKTAGFKATFPKLPDAAVEAMRSTTLVLDCTADDDVLRTLRTAPWRSDALAVSISIGAFAQRLYAYAAHATDFDSAMAMAALEPWLDKDRQDLDAAGEIREGIGCWHPVFPARFDHMTALCAVAIDWLDSLLTSPLPLPLLTVFERTTDARGTLKVERVTSTGG